MQNLHQYQKCETTVTNLKTSNNQDIPNLSSAKRVEASNLTILTSSPGKEREQIGGQILRMKSTGLNDLRVSQLSRNNSIGHKSVNTSRNHQRRHSLQESLTYSEAKDRSQRNGTVQSMYSDTNHKDGQITFDNPRTRKRRTLKNIL